MQGILRELPSTLVLGALVAIFVALQRRRLSRRVHWWLIGWGLMFLHVLVRLVPLSAGAGHFVLFVEIATMQVAGVAFLTSVAPFNEVRGPLRFIGHGQAVLLGVFSILVAWPVEARWAYVACLAPFLYSGAIFAAVPHRPQRSKAWLLIPLASATFATWALFRVGRGDVSVGCYAALLMSYSLTAMLFWRRYPRLSPGVVATCGGFMAWSGMWVLGIFAPRWIDAIGAQSELWNVPKYIVAVGMILVLLEDEAEASSDAREREHAANVQIQSFAEVTSRLLSGADAKSLCGHIAQVITQTTTFQRVVIGLLGDGQRFHVAGHAGLTEDVLAHVKAAVSNLEQAAITQLCSVGRHIGNSAVICTAAQSRPCGAVRSTRHYPENPNWHDGDELLVPLRSPRGAFVGFISLDDPLDALRVTEAEISKIEMLAGDIAVAADNAALQRQLVTTEKLAGLGQLVGGVAHELNNPLTAVLGYSELLGDQAADDSMRRGLGIIHREGRRMKDIIDNLLRFAQKAATERKTIDLMPVLQTLMREKSADARNRGIEVVEELGPGPLRVTADELQMRQVFVNIFNNAVEAVEKAAQKRISVAARCEDHRVTLSFTDTGPGFGDTHRIFDPFFTTKSPGKGTGLGLSICYGVLRQHGGTITARNVEPTGACVTIELPLAQEASASASV